MNSIQICFTPKSNVLYCVYLTLCTSYSGYDRGVMLIEFLRWKQYSTRLKNCISPLLFFWKDKIFLCLVTGDIFRIRNFRC